MTTDDKLYQRIDLFVNLHTEFNLARNQTTLFAEFWFRKNRTTYEKTRLTKQRQNLTNVALFVLLN